MVLPKQINLSLNQQPPGWFMWQEHFGGIKEISRTPKKNKRVLLILA